jgi:glycosyltransferase involved in cell wall biosynthesis
VKVLHLTFAYPTLDRPANGIFVREHVLASSRSAQVAVIHLDRGGGRYSIDPLPGEPFPALRVRYPRSRAAYPLHFIGAYAAFRRLRRTGFAPDLIHAHFFPAALPPLLLKPLFRLPVVVTEQWSVFLPEDPATLSPALARLARFAFRRAAFVLPPSDALRRGMVACGIRARYRVVPNVVDTELFTPRAHLPGEPRRLVFVGLLYDAKGIPDLLAAIAVLARTQSDFVLQIVGDGPGRAAYETLSHEHGVDRIVTFLGFHSKPEIARLLQEADLFVITSRYDNNPCALIEAQASGLPAVATRVGGIPEIVDAASGVLAEPGDPQSIAASIGDALNRLGEYDRDAIARRARERYGVLRIADLLAEIYAESTART